ncbi:MAG: hypothetical protein ACIWVG_31235, partial [Gloeotrichia echinulata HAB0833]
MNSEITKTLLALLLALRKLGVPLEAHQQGLLQDIGQQLALDPDPDDWNFIEEELIGVIEQNPDLNKLFKYSKVNLDTMYDKILRDFFPSQANLKRELFGEEKEIVTFDGSINGENSDSDRTTQIINITSTILQTENQDQTTKQLVFLEQISQYVENYRYFNTYFTEPNNQTLIPQTEPLIHGQTYFLCININPKPQGIDTTTFPDKT